MTDREMFALLFLICSYLARLHASFLQLDVYYPEEKLDSTVDQVFMVGLSNFDYASQVDPAKPWIQPYFGDITNPPVVIKKSKDRIEKDHWRKMIDLGAKFQGTVHILLSDNNASTSILACLNTISIENGQYFGVQFGPPCIPRHGTYSAFLSDPAATAQVTIYPAFDAIAIGKVWTMFPLFQSTTLGNYRPISVYAPSSLIENPIRRKVNVLVHLDGTEESLYYYSFTSGFDSAVSTGGAPESIMIGVPPTDGGTNCPQNSCNQRSFEMTPTECDPNVAPINGCSPPPQKYGGADIFLDFIWNDVIPAVLGNLTLDRGEVSIFGGSFGGMTSCYAAATRPTQFERAYCLSPSVWWNFGEMSSIITSSYARSGLRPKSIVIMVGSQEGSSLFFSPNTKVSPVPWTEFIKGMTDALVSIGMGATPASTGEYPSVNSDLIYFIWTGGVHTSVSWGDVFSYGISMLYTPEYPLSNRVQRNVGTVWVYPTQPSDKEECGDNSQIAVIGLGVAFAATSLALAVALAFIYNLKSGGQPLSSQTSDGNDKTRV